MLILAASAHLSWAQASLHLAMVLGCMELDYGRDTVETYYLFIN